MRGVVEGPALTSPEPGAVVGAPVGIELVVAKDVAVANDADFMDLATEDQDDPTAAQEKGIVYGEKVTAHTFINPWPIDGAIWKSELPLPKPCGSVSPSGPFLAYGHICAEPQGHAGFHCTADLSASWMDETPVHSFCAAHHVSSLGCIYSCTRYPGHPGPHVAATSLGKMCAAWTNSAIVQNTASPLTFTPFAPYSPPKPKPSSSCPFCVGACKCRSCKKCHAKTPDPCKHCRRCVTHCGCAVCYECSKWVTSVATGPQKKSKWCYDCSICVDCCKCKVCAKCGASKPSGKCKQYVTKKSFSYCLLCPACCICPTTKAILVVPWKTRKQKVVVDKTQVENKSKWFETVDPIQAMADFYLLSYMTCIHGYEYADLEYLAAWLVYADAARETRDRLVAEVDPFFVQYVDMVVGGELRYHKAVADSKCLIPDPGTFLHDDIPGRGAAWSLWDQVRAQVGPQALLDAAAMFEDGSLTGGVGGKAWANVARLLHARVTGQIEPWAFVDRVFTMQHNGGSLLNKVLWGHTHRCQYQSLAFVKHLGDAHAANPPNFPVMLLFASGEVESLFRAWWTARNRVLVSLGTHVLRYPDWRSLCDSRGRIFYFTPSVRVSSEPRPSHPLLSGREAQPFFAAPPPKYLGARYELSVDSQSSVRNFWPGFVIAEPDIRPFNWSTADLTEEEESAQDSIHKDSIHKEYMQLLDPPVLPEKAA